MLTSWKHLLYGIQLFNDTMDDCSEKANKDNLRVNACLCWTPCRVHKRHYRNIVVRYFYISSCQTFMHGDIMFECCPSMIDGPHKQPKRKSKEWVCMYSTTQYCTVWRQRSGKIFTFPVNSCLPPRETRPLWFAVHFRHSPMSAWCRCYCYEGHTCTCTGSALKQKDHAVQHQIHPPSLQKLQQLQLQ